ncbi:hypothetical protein F4818DRAFT_444978 [Hypoxylon cercidicola]|nr:hypothetical protein F4818DRAFT_444978 [Hypoxylon cercidicola]
MASQAQEHRASRSPYAHSQPSRNSDLGNVPPRIIVEPTPDYQHIYNDIRQTQERQRLQMHLACQQNLLPPPSAPSTSTIHSPTDEPVTPSTQEPTSQDADLPRRPRGRRRGPLPADTRWNTHVKRKLKLTCPHHRAKKTKCNCHDFSLLEEGYQSFLQQRSTSHRRSQGSNDISPLTPSDRIFNREMFGIGGAAMDQEPLSTDIDILQSTAGDDDNVVRSDVQQIVSGFDADTVRLDRIMLQAPGQTYHPGNDIGTPSPRGYPQEDDLEIGSQNPFHPNRWYCRYKGDVDSLAEASSQCPWTGTMDNLRSHFWIDHHPFQDASPRFWHVCTHCGTKVQPQNDLGPPPLHCATAGCLDPTFERWYFGSTRSESVADSIPGLTQSSESEAAFSYLSPDGDQSRLGGRGSGGAYNPYLGADNSYELANFYNAKWDTNSNSSDELSGCGCYARDGLRSLARRDGAERHSSILRAKLYRKARPEKCSPRQCPIRLLSYVKLSVGHLLSIMLPLLVTTVIRESGYLFEPSPSSLCTLGSDATSWWSLVLLCLGFLTTWAFKDQQARTRSADKVVRQSYSWSPTSSKRANIDDVSMQPDIRVTSV